MFKNKNKSSSIIILSPLKISNSSKENMEGSTISKKSRRTSRYRSMIELPLSKNPAKPELLIHKTIGVFKSPKLIKIFM
jgi:hypothetical protein